MSRKGKRRPVESLPRENLMAFRVVFGNRKLKVIKNENYLLITRKISPRIGISFPFEDRLHENKADHLVKVQPTNTTATINQVTRRLFIEIFEAKLVQLTFMTSFPIIHRSMFLSHSE